MQGYNRPIGPTPGTLNMPGMGGPGQGMASVPQGMQADPMAQFLEWLRLQGAGGYGIGPYGYPLSLGVPLNSQQNRQLNDQWGIRGTGEYWGR